MGDGGPGRVPHGGGGAVGGAGAGGRSRILKEVVVVWLATLLLVRLVVDGQRLLGLHEVVLVAVPLLFVYAPVLALRWQRVDPDQYPLLLPAFSDRAVWLDAARVAGLTIALILVPWLIGYHLYQTELFGFRFKGTLPSRPWELVGYHLFFVAIPEEMFYRGYMQSRLDDVWSPRWRWFGASVGPALLVTCVLFAAGHSIVTFQWWHFAIFFPSLIFGWLRARTGHVLAGAFFHAWCNVLVAFLDAAWGVTTT
jgi:hypothetical protein